MGELSPAKAATEDKPMQARATASRATGSIADVINGLSAQLQAYESLRQAERTFPGWGRVLQGAAERAVRASRQGDNLQGVSGAVGRLVEVMTDKDGVFARPEGKSL